jgi:hypothetical protein
MAYCDNPMCRDPECCWWQPYGYDPRKGELKIGSSNYSACEQKQKQRDKAGLTPHQRYIQSLATTGVELANALLNDLKNKTTTPPSENLEDKTKDL